MTFQSSVSSLWQTKGSDVTFPNCCPVYRTNGEGGQSPGIVGVVIRLFVCFQKIVQTEAHPPTNTSKQNHFIALQKHSLISCVSSLL